MARIFTAGAEEAGGIPMSEIWGSFGGTYLTSYGYAGPDILVPRTGAWSYRVNGESNFMNKGLSAVAEIYGGFAVYPVAFGTSIHVRFHTDAPGNNYDGISFQAGGNIVATRGTTAVGTGAGAITQNAWNYVEYYIKPRNSGGVFTVKVNGTQVINFSGDTTDSAESFSAVQFHGMNSGNWLYYDDIVINDVSGSVNNTWPGTVKLLPFRPRANGDTNQLSRVGLDLGVNFAQVRNIGEGAALQSSTVDHQDLFLMDIPDLPDGATISNIVSLIRAQTGSGGRSVALTCKVGGTQNDLASQALPSSYGTIQGVWAVAPDDSAAWAEADLGNSLQLGIKVK